VWIPLTAHTTLEINRYQKHDKIVPPSFKALRMKKANHIAKQTLYNPDRHMFYVQQLKFDKK